MKLLSLPEVFGDTIEIFTKGMNLLSIVLNLMNKNIFNFYGMIFLA